MNKNFLIRKARNAKEGLTASAPVARGVDFSDIPQMVAYYAGNLKTAKEDLPVINGLPSQDRLEIFKATPYGGKLSSMLDAEGFELIDVDFIPTATMVYPGAMDAQITFLDKEGILWRMKASAVKQELMSEVRMLGGVYVIYSGETVLYVGKSVNLRRRIKDHLSDGTKFFTADVRHRVTDVKYATLPDSVMHIAELYLISTLAPVFNKDAVPINPLPFEMQSPPLISMDGWEDLYKGVPDEVEEPNAKVLEFVEAIENKSLVWPKSKNYRSI